MLSVQQFAKRHRLSRSRVQQLIMSNQITPQPVRLGNGRGFWLIHSKAKIVRQPQKKRGKR